MIGSDGIPLPGTPHPRLTGTFSRVLDGHRNVSLTGAVKKMTGDTARRFRIPNRGVIRPGAFADITMFDPVTVADKSTFANPWIPPDGVEHVLIAGRAAVWHRRPVNTASGVVLRRR